MSWEVYSHFLKLGGDPRAASLAFALSLILMGSSRCPSSRPRVSVRVDGRYRIYHRGH